jgi:hypothetical protein
MKPIITIPVTILQKKIPGKTDSIFYRAKGAVAEVTIGSRQYVLTSAGDYAFIFKGRHFGPYQLPRNLTDRSIKTIEDPALWGWFGVNVWAWNEQDKDFTTCLQDNTDAFSDYDEAMEGFITFVQNDVTGKTNPFINPR